MYDCSLIAMYSKNNRKCLVKAQLQQRLKGITCGTNYDMFTICYSFFKERKKLTILQVLNFSSICIFIIDILPRVFVFEPVEQSIFVEGCSSGHVAAIFLDVSDGVGRGHNLNQPCAISCCQTTVRHNSVSEI